MHKVDHNLGIFKILYIIKGIIILLFSILPLIFLIFGAVLFQENQYSSDDSAFGGIMIMIIGCTLFLFLFVLGILTMLTAKYLGEKKNYDFIFVMAIINCLTGILGIIMGIFTILELTKPDVKRLFVKQTREISE
ncbi:hypothetical protein [Christiangramia sabulilitoris]|uniref:DUF4064 domain-containing protein n=1 Tax=Christiangramia sabulilitoris TaxID=2583991 RepID=A0A550I799_9FLAO|nr:hypothetical protein [Christiangramia sabulilitoris]TRO66850.1 hypothetical protein FGM01_02860 [Christiangramia sabulilitoris]